MYQYKAILRSDSKVIVEGHTIEEIEHGIKSFQRKHKTGEHTRSNEIIDIFHMYRDTGEKKLVKSVSNMEDKK